MSETIDDFAAEAGFGLLVFENAIFQVTARDLFHPVHGRLRQASAMIAHFFLPTLASSLANAPNRLVTRERLRP